MTLGATCYLRETVATEPRQLRLRKHRLLVLEDFVHHRLEGRRAVGQSKVHHEWFEQTAISSKCRFPFITFFYPHIVIPPGDIELGEVLCAFESVDEVVNEREGIPILPSDQIQCAIVLDKAKFSVFLLDEEDRGAYW